MIHASTPRTAAVTSVMRYGLLEQWGRQIGRAHV